MKRILSLMLLWPMLASAQLDFSAFTETTNFEPSDTFLIQTGLTSGLRFTRKIRGSNILEELKTFPGWPADLTITATNKNTTNSLTFGVFDRKTGNRLDFFTIKQGTNVVIYTDANSNIVINATGTGGGGSGGGVFSSSQFDSLNGTTNIKSGALVTNLSSLNFTNRGTLTNVGASDFTGIGHFYSNMVIDGTTLASGALQVGLNANFLSSMNITGRLIADGTNNSFTQDLTIGSNNVVNGTNISKWVRLSGGQASGSFLVTDGNTNVQSWLGTNVIGNLSGATNGLNEADSNLQGATNGLNSALSSLSSRSLTNNHSVPVTLETNLNVRGRATNENGLVVWNGGNPAVRIYGTNGGVPSLMLQDYGSAFPYIALQNAGGTAATPLADTVAGDVVGSLELAAYGGSLYKTALSFRPIASGAYSDSAAPTLVRVGVGNPAGTPTGRAIQWWTSENITNDANLVVKSNIIVEGGALIGGSLTGGSILSQGILSAVGVVTANTNADVLGTNRARWLKLDGGQAASSLLRLDSNTNVVAASIGTGLLFDGTTLSATGGAGTTDYTGDYGITNATHIGINQSRQGVTNFLRTVQAGNGVIITNEGTNIVFAIDTAVTATQTDIANTLTNANSIGVSNSTSKPIFLRKQNRMIDYFTLVSGPNVTLTMSATNSIVIDAPSSALSDGDKGDITVSGSGATWTVDNDAITVDKMQEIAGFSIFAKGTTGTGNPTVVTAGTDSVLGRNGSGNLGFAALATGQIANDAVTYAKLQNISATDRILGRDSTGAGDAEELTLSQALDFIGSAAQGDILYRGATAWERLGAGTSGQVLTTAGAGANPSWQTSSGGTGSTNSPAFSMNSLVLTGSVQYVASSAFLRTTNLWLDGGVSSLYSNVLAANAGGLTNVLVTNILDGQTVDYWLFPSNGVTVQLPQFTAAQWGGAAPKIESNLWNRIELTRYGSVTNLRHSVEGYALVFGSGTSTTTNHATREITLTASSGPSAPILVTNSYVGGGTNFTIDGSSLSNNTIVRITLTKASGILTTNLSSSDGKVFDLEVEEDSTGGWRLITNGPNWRLSQEIPEMFIETNATTFSAFRLKVRGTNLWVVGNLSKFAP